MRERQLQTLCDIGDVRALRKHNARLIKPNIHDAKRSNINDNNWTKPNHRLVDCLPVTALALEKRSFQKNLAGMASSGDNFDATYPNYWRDINSIQNGLNLYEDSLPTSKGSVQLIYFTDLIWDGETLHCRSKPGGAALTHVSNIQEIPGTYSVSEKLFSHKG